MLVLFDLDGTILDSLPGWAQAYRNAVHPRRLTDEDIARDLFHPTHESLLRHGVTDERRYFQSLNRFLRENPQMSVIAENADEAMDELRAGNHTLGILTARPKEIAIVNIPDKFLSKFKVVLDREDAKPKPHPDGVFKACERTGISIRETIMVGDHPVDAECAARAGILFLFYKPDNHVFRSHTELAKARTFSDFRELPGIVGSLSKSKMR